MTWIDNRERILTLKQVDHVSWLHERKGGSYQTFQTSCFRVKWNIMQLVSTACNKCYYVPIKQNIDNFNSTQNIDNYIWWHDSNKFSFPSQSLVQFPVIHDWVTKSVINCAGRPWLCLTRQSHITPSTGI